MSARILVAGIGNVFFGDDGYGVEVARLLSAQPPIDGVKVADYGIRGTHLAYELVSGYDGAILIDAVARGGEPGTLYVIEPDLSAPVGTPDAHSMNLGNVFVFMNALGGVRPRILVIGCEPAEVGEGIGLSDPVARALPETVSLVRDTIAKYFFYAPSGGRS